MSNLWFTADTHFGHQAMLRHRPWPSVHEMDEALIKLWNLAVRPEDEVWHLGDFAWERPESYFPRLNGTIHFVLGNHDNRKELNALTDVHDVRYLRLQKQRLFLSHYPHRAWRNSHHGSLHLFGHTHGDFAPWGRSMDIGVDAQAFAPVAFDEVVAQLKDRSIVDQHYKQQSPDDPTPFNIVRLL